MPSTVRREAARKLVHMASVAVPLGVWLAPRPVTVAVLVAAAVVALAIDVARLRVRGVRYRFLRLTRTMLRRHERRHLTGATYMAVSYAAAVLVFPKPVAVAAMLFNGLGDAAAALVGRRWGRRRTRWGKSWEGFAAELVVSLAAGLAVSRATGGFSALGAVTGALAAAALEFADLPVDDNVRVTLGGGVGILLGELAAAALG